MKPIYIDRTIFFSLAVFISTISTPANSILSKTIDNNFHYPKKQIFSDYSKQIVNKKNSQLNQTDQPLILPGQLIVKLKSPRAQGITRSKQPNLSDHEVVFDTRDELSSFDSLMKQYKVTRVRSLLTQTQRLRTQAPKIELQDKVTIADTALQRPAITSAFANIYLIDLDKSEDLNVVSKAFTKDANVVWAQPNLQYKAMASANDPYFLSIGSWGQDYADLWGVTKINADTAWDINRGAGAVVAVVDTGIDFNHADINDNIWRNPNETINGIDDDGNGYIDDINGWDFVDDDADATDLNGHGTHVSGTIAAERNNHFGIVGVAPEAKIMPVRGLDAFGGGSSFGLAQAIIYAAQNGADVINNSWGCELCPSDLLLEEAVDFAYAMNSVLVFSAGNSSDDISRRSPQNYKKTIVVSATDQYDALTDFSSFGFVDLAAPGGGVFDNNNYTAQDNILSLLATDTDWDPELVVGDKFLRIAGTSMAAPHVAAVAALIRAQHPNYSVEQVRQVLRRSAHDILTPGFDTKAGHGRVNAASALNEPTPLEVIILGPRPDLREGEDIITIAGTVNGASLHSYVLEYGLGQQPENWLPISNGTTSVIESTLAVWDATSVPDGAHTLRLTATTNNNQQYVDYHRVSLNRSVITSPNPGSYVRGGGTIELIGTATSHNFEKYKIKFEHSHGEEQYITLTNNGKKPIKNGVLATLDTSKLAARHINLVLVVVLKDGGKLRSKIQFVLDPSIHAGWPQQIELVQHNDKTMSFEDNVTATDINADGQAELLVGYNNRVKVFTHTGAQLPGWPQAINTNHSAALIQRSPAAGDFDRDGKLEIVAANDHGELFVWDHTGTLLDGFPRSLDNGVHSLALADINRDGELDIVATDWLGRVFVLSGSGHELPGFPANIASGRMSTPAIGDVDGDGLPEIAVVSAAAPSELFIINSLGHVLPGWPKALNTGSAIAIPEYVALADLDNDNDLEIVATSQRGKVYAFQHDGSALPNWPQQFTANHVSTPALGDITGDAVPEITVAADGSEGKWLYVWDASGKKMESDYYEKSRMESAPSLVDVDGDGRADAVGSHQVSAGKYALTATNLRGLILSPEIFEVNYVFWKPTNSGVSSLSTAPAFADLDGDGLLEMAIILADGSILVWDTERTASLVQPWPMVQHNATHSGAQPAPPNTEPVVPSRIEAENFQRFHDNTATHHGDCGSGPVDIRTTNDIDGRCEIFHTDAGEWLEYDVRAARDRKVDISLRLAGNNSNSSIRLELDGTTIGVITPGDTGAHSFVTKTLTNIYVSAGKHTIRVYFETTGVTLNYLELIESGVCTGNEFFCDDPTDTWFFPWQTWSGPGNIYIEDNPWIVWDTAVSASAGPTRRAMPFNKVFRNGKLRTNVKVGATGKAGLIYRVNDPGNTRDEMRGYFFGLCAENQRLIFAKMNHNFKIVKTQPFAVNADEPYLVEAVIKDNSHKFYIDNQLVLQANDAKHYAGSVGIAARNSATTWDNFSIVTATPFGASLPGRVEAEDFKNFYDTTPEHFGNCGSGPVDMYKTNDNNGRCSIGWTTAGEWLEYYFHVPVTGVYEIGLRVASNSQGNYISALVDGFLGAWGEVPNQGSDFSDINDKIWMAAGNHVMRIEFISGNVDINYWTLTWLHE